MMKFRKLFDVAMCYILSIGTELRPEVVKSLAPEGLQIQEGPSSQLRRIDPSMPFWLDLTDGRCSCDLCPTPERVQKTEDETERLVERYRKKGYSETRIERALKATSKTGGVRRRLGPKDTTAFLLALLKRTPLLVAFCRWRDGRVDDLAARAEHISITLTKAAALRAGWLPLDTAVRMRA